MARSESEETSKAGFDAFLRAHSPASSTKWWEGEDPPDYYLEFAGERFAVDVSILVEQVVLGRARLRWRDIRDALADFIRKVELSARQAGVLNGRYTVYVPRPIPDLRHEGPLLRQRILEFVAATRASPAGVWEEFYKVARRGCVIEKFDEHGSALVGGGPSVSRWATDAERELAQLVAERIAAKAADLQRIRMPKILVLDEQYPFAEAWMYSRVAQPICAADSFHTIYVSRRGVDGVLLTSRLPGLSGVWD